MRMSSVCVFSPLYSSLNFNPLQSVGSAIAFMLVRLNRAIDRRCSKRTEERTEFLRQCFRSFEAGEVPPAPHACPALYIPVHAFGERARRGQDFARMFGIPRRHHHLLAGRNNPRTMQAGTVQPEARIDRAREPIEHDVGQKHVTTEVTVDITVAITPIPELLDDPGSQADGGVR